MNSIAKIVIDLPVEGPFDYSVPDEFRERITIGARVLVPFGRRNMVGFVVGLQEKADVVNVRPLETLLDDGRVIDTLHMELARRVCVHYGCSWGEALAVSLPSYLRKSTKTSIPMPVRERVVGQRNSRSLYVTTDPARIHTVIIELSMNRVRNGASVILLVPDSSRPKEIAKALAPEGLPVVVYHGLTPKKEFESWVAMQKGEPCVIIGTRSAVFARPAALGAIIILDEDSPSYEQEQPPHYDAFDVARIRCQIEGADLVAVTPAPRAETWQTAGNEKWDIHREPAPAPKIQMVDMTNYHGKGGSISFPLQSEISALLNTKGTALLLMNRRGFAGRTSCNKCGHIMRCPRCDVNLTYIYENKKLACGRCKYEIALPKFCPQCNAEYLRSTGAGIEKIESELARIYPQAKIAVYDRDTESLPKKADIIVATQAILRWKDIYRPGMVAVLDLDAELNRFDFRSGQKAFGLLRRLRSMATGRMYVQTHMPDNATVKIALSNDPDVFYPAELALRREMSLPPFKRMIEIVMRGESEQVVLEQGRLIHAKLAELKNERIELSDLHADVIPKLRDKYRFALVLKGDNMMQLFDAARAAVKGSKRKRGVIVTIKAA